VKKQIREVYFFLVDLLLIDYKVDTIRNYVKPEEKVRFRGCKCSLPEFRLRTYTFPLQPLRELLSDGPDFL